MSKKNYTGPAEYKPLGAWAYFGYSILFSIPLIGLIFNLVYCFNNDNINRRNYARSFWCMYLLTMIVIVVAMVIAVSLGFTMDDLGDVVNKVEQTQI